MILDDRKTGDITVGIPFYSKSTISELKEAIDSILMQSVRPVVVHLIQNGSVPERVKVYIESVLQKHENVKLITTELPNLPTALNASIQATRSKYYARMDADDISHRDRLKVQLKYLESHPKVQIVGGFAREFQTGQNVEQGNLKQMPTSYTEMERWFHYRNPFVHASVVFRMSVFETLGYYNEDFSTDQDLELWARVFRMKIRVANVSETVVYFRTDNMISNRSKSGAVWRQTKARFSYNTINPLLNIYKTCALLFRLSPAPVRQFGYRKLRK